MKASKASCRNCKYVEITRLRNSPSGQIHETLRCHRFPPTSHGVDGGVFVQVRPHNWCGEWKTR